MSTIILALLIFSSSKYCRHRKCNYFKNCVALILGFRDCYFDNCVSSNLRYVTCSHRTYCHEESRAGRVQCFKMAKMDPVSPFHPLFDWKKQLCNGKTSLQAVNIYSCAFRNWKCLQNYRRPTMKIPEFRWCLTEMSFNNPGQSPGMF